MGTDQRTNGLRLAGRGRPPSGVVGEGEADADPSMAWEARHLMVDMRVGPSAEEPEDAMRLAEVTIIPITPLGFAPDTSPQTRRDLRRPARGPLQGLLLTAVPPWPYRRGPQAGAQLEELEIPLFETDVRWLEAFEAVAEEGVLVGHGLGGPTTGAKGTGGLRAGRR